MAKIRSIFDPIYGFIRLTPVEWDIIHGPFYQRLRWIKQLGFSPYVFHGAEHSRFGHSIGVMHNAHCILDSCGLALPLEELIESKSSEAVYHQSLRLAALMHDLGTFPFSHTTEQAYIRFGETTNKRGGKGLLDDHENLGSYIIKNTDYEDGVTKILSDHGIDPQEVSDLVKGVAPSILANQILHSDIDCDRMDYLLRDAHYTGLKYGAYDRDYLLYHFCVKEVGGHRILAINDTALHCVEDFLTARFAWYSQVIRSPKGAKYDALAEAICFWMLEEGIIARYSDILGMVASDPLSFYQFNDGHFMELIHQSLKNGAMDKRPDIKDMAKCLLLEKGAYSINTTPFKQRMMNNDDSNVVEREKKVTKQEIDRISQVLEKAEEKDMWSIADFPKKDISFIKSKASLIKKGSTSNLLLERDPVKIVDEQGNIRLLSDVESSLISKLENICNFTPNFFCSKKAFDYLEGRGELS